MLWGIGWHLTRLALALSCFVLVRTFQSWLGHGGGAVLILVSAVYSYRELDRRLDLKLVLATLQAKVRRKLKG